mgnify:CR=1 FL=1
MTYWEPEGFYQLGEGKHVRIIAGEVRPKRVTMQDSTHYQTWWTGLEGGLWLLTDARHRSNVPGAWLQAVLNPAWTLANQGSKHRVGFHDIA